MKKTFNGINNMILVITVLVIMICGIFMILSGGVGFVKQMFHTLVDTVVWKIMVTSIVLFITSMLLIVFTQKNKL